MKLDIDILINEDDFACTIKGERVDVVDSFVNLILTNPQLVSILEDAITEVKMKYN